MTKITRDIDIVTECKHGNIQSTCTECAKQKALHTQQQLEKVLTVMGFEPTDEWEEPVVWGTVMFTKWEKNGIGVRIERNL